MVHNTDGTSTCTTSIQLKWDVGLDGPVFQKIVMTELQEPENDGFNPSALLLSAWTYKIADPLIKVGPFPLGL